MRYVLYNPLSSHCPSEDTLKSEMEKIDSSKELTLVDMTKIEDGDKFLKELKEGDDLVISGGDGTLNHVVNSADFDSFDKPVYLYKAGNGNDFLRDINNLEENFIEISKYLKNLPIVTINGKTTKYINGVGFGVDGMVCVESDKMKANGVKNINYTTLAIKLLLFKFKKVAAKVIVDGKEYRFKNVFIGSAMNGRYYGGGMKEAPDQDRLSDKVSVVVWHDFNRLTGLMNFPKIFTGEHVKNTKKITVLTGKEITMSFSLPTDLQIDGESLHGIFTYKVSKK